MPAHQDAYISDVVVVVECCDDATFDKVLAQTKELGLDVRELRRDEHVIEGTIESSKLVDLDNVPGVEYVRSVFTYVADYPPGDPRDRLAWITDVRTTLEKYGIGWTVWEYTGGFGIVTKRDGQAIPDEPTIRALGRRATSLPTSGS